MSQLPPEVGALLGVRSLREVEFAHLARLVGSDENEWLDVKGVRDSDQATLNVGEMWRGLRSSLAEDVGAFANHSGGLIVLGACERTGVIDSVNGLPRPRGELELALQQSLQSRVRPIPSLGIRTIPIPAKPSHVVALICVPAGASAPYAVEVDRGYARYLRRERRGNRALSESEIAALYRHRFELLPDRQRRLAALSKRNMAIAERLFPDATFDGYPFYVQHSLVPLQDGSVVVSSPGMASLERDAANLWSRYLAPLNGRQKWHVRVVPGGVRAYATVGEGMRVTASALLRRNGSVSIGSSLMSPRRVVPSEWLLGVSTALIAICLRHARSTGARGDFLFASAALVPVHGEPVVLDDDANRVFNFTLEDDELSRVGSLEALIEHREEFSTFAFQVFSDLIAAAGSLGLPSRADDVVADVFDRFVRAIEPAYSA